MFRVGASVERTHFNNLIEMLIRKPLLVNHSRTNSGVGRSQAFGITKQRNSDYAGSSHNYKRMDVFQELLSLAKKILPKDYKFDAIQVNQNYETTPHKDRGNKGESAIIAFGTYEGGELVVEDVPVDIGHRIVFFDGSVYTHFTKPFKGVRFSLVFYCVDRDFKETPLWDFHTHNKQTYLSETLNGATIWYDKSGNKIFDETGEYKPKEKRKPSLRSLKEVTSSSPQIIPLRASQETLSLLSDLAYS